MQDLWWHLKDTDSFTIYLALGFAVVVGVFIHEIVRSPMLAWVSAPILVAGGIVAPTLLDQFRFTLSYDKTIHSVAAVAVGTLGILLLILAFGWLWTLLLEYRVKRTRLVTLPAPAKGPRR